MIRDFVKAILGLLPLFVGSVSGFPANAENEFLDSDQALGLISFATVLTSDQVSGNCLTNLPTIENKLKLMLEQNDVSVVESKPYTLKSPAIGLIANGYRVEGVCVASFAFEVRSWGGTTFYDQSDGSGYAVSTLMDLYSSHQISTNRSNVNAQALDFFEGEAAGFLAQVIASRKKPIVAEAKRKIPWFVIAPPTAE
jgi:hypothetical protein